MQTFADAAAIEAVLDTVRPALKKDGGDVAFVSFEDGTVTLRLSGACASCAMSGLTVKLGLEPAIRAAVPGVHTVTAIKDPEVKRSRAVEV